MKTLTQGVYYNLLVVLVVVCKKKYRQIQIRQTLASFSQVQDMKSSSKQ